MKIEIKRWNNKKVIHSGDFDNVKECLEDGVKKEISFAYTDLSNVDLSNANLQESNMYRSNLSESNLFCSDISNVYLDSSNLSNTTLDKVNSVWIGSGEEYWLYISEQVVVAGCQSYSPEEWRRFTEGDIYAMDCQKAVDFYPRLIKLMDFYLGE